MRETCANCGKKAAKSTDRISLLNDEEYQGNLQIVRKKTQISESRHVRTNLHTGERTVVNKITDIWVWDGESYEPMRYGYFCTLRCAQFFANGAYAAGYRVIK